MHFKDLPSIWGTEYRITLIHGSSSAVKILVGTVTHFPSLCCEGKIFILLSFLSLYLRFFQ